MNTECIYSISLIMKKYQISQNLLGIYRYIKIHIFFVYHQWGKSHVKKIPKFVKVSQNKSVQKNKNAEKLKKIETSSIGDLHRSPDEETSRGSENPGKRISRPYGCQRVDFRAHLENFKKKISPGFAFQPSNNSI